MIKSYIAFSAVILSLSSAISGGFYGKNHLQIADRRGNIMIDPHEAYNALHAIKWSEDDTIRYLLKMKPQQRVFFVKKKMRYGPAIESRESLENYKRYKILPFDNLVQVTLSFRDPFFPRSWVAGFAKNYNHYKKEKEELKKGKSKDEQNAIDTNFEKIEGKMKSISARNAWLTENPKLPNPFLD